MSLQITPQCGRLHTRQQEQSALCTAAGIGATRALSLIQKHGSLEKVLDSLDPSKYSIPDPFPYHEARRLFQGAPFDNSSLQSSSLHDAGPLLLEPRLGGAC